MRNWQLNGAALLLFQGLLWLAPAGAEAQEAEVAAPIEEAAIVEEEAFVEEEAIFEEDLGEDIETLLAAAEEVFRSADQPESIALYERIILLLERHRAEGTLGEPGGEWLKEALFRRAEARSNLLDEEGASADLRSIVLFDPDWELPAGYTVSRLLSDLLAGVRDAETGVLDPLIDPPDAELYLDGEPLAAVSGPRRVLAGERLLEVRRPGYTAVEQPLTVAPGETVPIELTLERSSAAVRLITTPAGVEVVHHGRVAAVSEAGEEGREAEASRELAVDGLEVGEQILTLRKPGYRSLDVRVQIAELADYRLDPVALEPTRGTVVLSQVPAGARLLLDGEARAAAAERRTGLRMDMAPGEHLLRIEAGPAGLFESRFQLADRQLLEIDVVLRPGLVLLGVLGGDRVAADGLEGRLVKRLGALSQWALSRRAGRGFELLREAGVDRHRLRALADGVGSAPDWEALQGAFDAGLGGSAYLLAVLSDDLYASRADLWLWSAAHGPTRPARRRIPLTDSAGLEELAAALDRPLELSASWVGARFVDSPIAELPLVLSVEPDGPAAGAGLEPGDVVSAVAGEAVSSAAGLVARIAGLEAGREVAFELGGEGGERSIAVTPATGPAVASLNDAMALDPALAARLASLEAGADAAAPAWVVRLNRGVVLMRSGEWRRAAEALRGLEAPAGDGVGQATVDYLLGVALLEVDRAAYQDTALGLIGRAAESRARLEHNDGPLLAPRARARLETLLAEPRP